MSELFSTRNPIPAALLLLVGAVAGAAALAPFEWLSRDPSPRAFKPPCWETGEPFHHRYRAGCVSEISTPDGRVRFSINEDGLREAARATVLKNPARALVVGGASVEGWWAEAAQSLPAELTAAVPGIYFVNAGLREAGPLFQSQALPRLLSIYKPRRVFWFLDEKAAGDDRLACAMWKNSFSGGSPEFAALDTSMGGWRGEVLSLAGETRLGFYLRIRFLAARRRELEAASSCKPCEGVRKFLAATKAAGVGVTAVFVEQSPAPGAPPALAACLAREKVELHYANLPPDLSGGFFWEGTSHLTPTGAMVLAQSLAALAREHLSAVHP